MRASAEQFEVFERMHFVCFHYQFEHGDADIDQDDNSDRGLGMMPGTNPAIASSP